MTKITIGPQYTSLQFRGRLAGVCFVSLAMMFSSCASSSPARRQSFDVGPLSSRDNATDGNLRTRAVGPFFEKQTATNGTTFLAVRPFYSRTMDPVKERNLTEFLWPLGMVKEFQGEKYWRFIVSITHDFDMNDPDSRFRFWVLPVLFAGSDVNRENYFAVFPVGGKVNEFLGRDRIIFALFPLYLYSEVDGIKTTDILFPFISRTKGKDVSRFRILPFYMQSESGDRFASRSIMWPIWTSVKYNQPDSKGGGFVLFPLFGHVKLTNQETWMFLPPFFRFSESNHGRSGNFPWPFIQYSAADPERLYIWPIWGYEDDHGIKSSFFLWPIGRTEYLVRPDYEQRRFSITPVVFYESRVKKEKTDDNVVKEDVIARYFRLWPLASYRREGDSFRFRTLELWPARQTPAIERNWAALYTLYSHTRTAENSEDELLWGLFRRGNRGKDERSWSVFPLFSWNKTPGEGGGREWNFLKGLVGYKRDGLLKTYRLLYLLKFNSKGETKP